MLDKDHSHQDTKTSLKYYFFVLLLALDGKIGFMGAFLGLVRFEPVKPSRFLNNWMHQD